MLAEAGLTCLHCWYERKLNRLDLLVVAELSILYLLQPKKEDKKIHRGANEYEWPGLHYPGYSFV